MSCGLEIEFSDDDETRYYIFDDVANLFWPGDFDYSNHSAQERIIAALEERGCKKIKGWCNYLTPVGEIGFDSESGTFECHAKTREPVEYIAGVIEEIVTEAQHYRQPH